MTASIPRRAPDGARLPFVLLTAGSTLGRPRGLWGLLVATCVAFVGYGCVL